MFIKKLPENPDWTDGWCLLRDVFHRMPLSVFVKIVNVNYRAEELDDYLNHPIKQHFPLMDLPCQVLPGFYDYTRKTSQGMPTPFISATLNSGQ